MPTECNPALFEFPPVESRHVVAGFDGGAITSDAGALLLDQLAQSGADIFGIGKIFDIFLGRGIRPGRYDDNVRTADIAPTLAALLGVNTPSGSVGRILPIIEK